MRELSGIVTPPLGEEYCKTVYGDFMSDFWNMMSEVQNSVEIFANTKSYHSSYMSLPDFQNIVNGLCLKHRFTLSCDTWIDENQFMNVTVDCIHHSGFSYRRHCSYYNVPNIMLMHDSQNLNQGMHQYNYKNQLDYTFGISAMATSAQRRALYAFFNIHPDKQREPAYNDSQYVQYHQGQQQQQQQFNAQPPQQINLQAQQQPQQQQQFAGQVQGDQPVTQPSAQPEPQPGQTPELTLENPMFADISNVIASFQNTSLAKWVWGVDDAEDLNMLSSFLDSIGINTQQMKEEAWNLGVSQVANPLEHTGLLKTYLYWLMVDYIRTELAPKD